MSRPMLAWQSALMFLQILSGGVVLLEFIESRWVGLLVLSVGAAQGATAFYQRGVSQRPVEVGT